MASTGDALDSPTTLVSDKVMDPEQEAFAPVMAPTRDMPTFGLPIITTLADVLDSDTEPAAQKDSINAFPCYGAVTLLTELALTLSTRQVNELNKTCTSSSKSVKILAQDVLQNWFPDGIVPNLMM